MVALIIGREFAITALRSLAYTKGITIPASPLGKIKMASQVTAILLLILGWGPLPWLAPIGYVALWAVMILAVVVGSGLLPPLPETPHRPRDRCQRRASTARWLTSIPDSQLPTSNHSQYSNSQELSIWALGVGSGWELGVGSWELLLLSLPSQRDVVA